MRDVAVIGVSMTKFGKFLDKGIKDLVREAVEGALQDADMDKNAIEAAFVGNGVAGIMTGQEMIRGQVTLNPMGIQGIPVYNLESACASSSSAFNLAWTSVAAGVHDCALVVGFEKLYHKDKRKPFQALETAIDVEDGIAHLKEIVQEGSGENRSVFMDVYAHYTKRNMKKFGLTQEDFARLSVKSHKNGSLNPLAQYQKPVTIEEVLQSGDVVYPLTRMMCAPIGDGAAAAILCAGSKAAQHTIKPIWVAASVMGSGITNTDPDDNITVRLAPKVYDKAEIGSEDIDVIEVHDATTPSEIIDLIDLGLCPGDEAKKWINEGYLELDGKLPTNPSGGLVSKGHPVGATGCGMIYEIVKQLRGEAGKRQVKNPKIGMTMNGGGVLVTDTMDTATMSLNIFKR
ncbi:MAG: thiolase family protein [Deltaproteobacteria bacterium]|nr:thiolase family protein [Deltaproteobacteria bacterium]